jgi:hypothetical protein
MYDRRCLSYLGKVGRVLDIRALVLLSEFGRIRLGTEEDEESSRD